jgi:putative PIN family toxin of toxin-antitoxin system
MYADILTVAPRASWSSFFGAQLSQRLKINFFTSSRPRFTLSPVYPEELTRVLRYPKFQLSSDHRNELLAEYLPYCEIVKETRKSKLSCRNKNDQPFLDLAESGKADLLVTGDRDLLVLAGQTRFLIETPAAYRARVSGLQDDTFS